MSDENKAEFELIKNIWADSEDAALLPVDTEQAWQSLNTKITEKRKTKIILFNWKKSLAIAASVILLAGVFYYFLQPGDIKWEDTYAATGNKVVRLADGTLITLRKGAILSVPDNFGKESRQVKLKGEAYFEIEHKENNPFSITTSRSLIRDIGTLFIVQNNDSLDQVSVLEGEVSFVDRRESRKPVSLLAGETAILKHGIPKKVKVGTTNLLSWNSNILIFNNTPLFQVTKDLEDYFQVEFIYDTASDYSSLPITAEFRNEPLTQVIGELNLLTGLKFETKGESVIISK